MRACGDPKETEMLPMNQLQNSPEGQLFVQAVLLGLLPFMAMGRAEHSQTGPDHDLPETSNNLGLYFYLFQIRCLHR